jgi:hypothetical protein
MRSPKGIEATFPDRNARYPGVLIDEKLILFIEDPRKFHQLCTREKYREDSDLERK